jgi:flagellar motor switch protein FliN/FliY
VTSLAEICAGAFEHGLATAAKRAASPSTATLGGTFAAPAPYVRCSVLLDGTLEGETVIVLPVAQAEVLARGLYDGLAEGEGLSDALVREFAGELAVAAVAALVERAGAGAEHGAAQTRLLADGDPLPVANDGGATVHVVFAGDEPVELFQLVPAGLAALLAGPVGAVERDPCHEAVERAAQITADAAQSVLSMLMGKPTTASAPVIEDDPPDPLGTITYPMVAIEVSYAAGVKGRNLFALTPDQVARMAAAMIGSDAIGDGTSELELSAASEAMNQLMGSATRTMADVLAMDIDIEPPRCQVIDSPDAARELFGEWAYIARFQLENEDVTADVVQLVALDFAEHMREAFERADAAHAVLADAVAATAPPSFDPLPHPTPDPSEVVARVFHGGLLRGTTVRVSAELGRTRLPIRQVANMPAGTVVPLDRDPFEPIDILANGEPFAQAKLMLVDGEYAVQIVSLTPSKQAAARERPHHGGTSIWHE